MFILSHPLHGNYGGMLQAYALQKALLNMSYSVTYVNLNIPYITPPKNVGLVKHWVKYFLMLTNIMTFYIFVKQRVIQTFCKSFSNIITVLPTEPNTNQSEESSNWIVGSDQVWRASYVRPYGDVSVFFLSFLNKKTRKKSISYAASFGSDEWDGFPEETEECRRLLCEFKAVSVREHSGVKICKEVFGVDAVQMPDPTLLLHLDDYGKIIDRENTWLPDSKYVASYVLDETEGKAELLRECAREGNMSLQHLMPHADAKNRRDRFPISVPQWLRLIRDCEYFITDSFHGCVFAITYNKPFVCLGNEGRGNARFDTLLGTFGLEDRMITDATPEKVLQVLHTPIDWKRVNAIHDSERERGINFLKENLCE